MAVRGETTLFPAPTFLTSPGKFHIIKKAASLHVSSLSPSSPFPFVSRLLSSLSSFLDRVVSNFPPTTFNRTSSTELRRGFVVSFVVEN